MEKTTQKIKLDDFQNLDLIKKNLKLKIKPKQDRCLFCQKPMNINDNTKYVHLLTSSELTLFENHIDSQGLFPIGNECKNKIDKKYIF